MFDVGFSELFVIAIVALVVLGPERLPKAARLAGLWMRRARAQWVSVRSELENELVDEQFKRSLQQTRQELRQAQAQLHDGGQMLHGQFDAAAMPAVSQPAASLPQDARPDGDIATDTTDTPDPPLSNDADAARR